MRDRFSHRSGGSQVEWRSPCTPLLCRIAAKLGPNKKVEQKQWRRKHAHTFRMKHTDEQVKAAIRRILAGEKYASVAESIDAEKSTVYQWSRGLMRGHLLDEVMKEMQAA